MRAINLPLTMFLCPGCARPLTLIVLPAVRRPITLTCPDCKVECRIGPEPSAPAPPRYAEAVV